MKVHIAILLIALLMAACTLGESVNTDANSPDTMPNESVSTDTNSPVATPGESAGIGANNPDAVPDEPDDTGSSSGGEKEYFEVKTEFKYEIEQAAQGKLNDWAWGLEQTFQEMLQYRESLEDVNEEMGVFYSYRYDDFWMSIDVREVFSDGKTSYRILLFSTQCLPYERMYIQVYDEENFKSKCIGEYALEGGSYGEALLIPGLYLVSPRL